MRAIVGKVGRFLPSSAARHPSAAATADGAEAVDLRESSATRVCGTAVAQQEGVTSSPRVPDEASLQEFKVRLAEALEAVLTVSWCDGRLRLSVATGKRPQGDRVVLQAQPS